MQFAINAAGIGVWELDIATNTILLDNRCCRLFGLSGVNELPFEEVLQHIHPSDATAFSRNIEAVLNGENNGQCNVNVRIKTVNGLQPRWVNFSGKTSVNDAGRVTRFGGIAQDVSQTVSQQQQTLRFQQQIISLLEQSYVAIAIIAKDGLTFTAANVVYGETVGRLPHQMIGKRLADVFPKNEIEPFEALLQNVLTTGNPFLAKEARIETLVDGKPKISYINFAYQPLYSDADLPYAVLVVANDVTPQVVAKQMVEESERTLRRTILQTPFAVCVFRGPDFIIETANEKMFEFWGKTAEQVMNKPLFEAIPEAKGQGYEELLNNVLQTGEPFSARECPVILPRNGVPQTVLIDFSY